MAKTTSNGFVVCLRNDGAEDLEVCKIYLVVPDEDARAKGFLRIVDESSEDYLYPAEFFAKVDIPEAAATELRATAPSE